MTLDDGTIIHTVEPATGRVGIAVYPWEIAVTAQRPATGNVIAGTIGSVTPDRGRTRVRIGALVAEVSAVDGLVRGAPAFASFEPANARLVVRDEC